MNYCTKKVNHDDNTFMCPCCGEIWSYDEDGVKMIGTEYLCPACYRDREDNVKRIYNRLDDYEIELMRKEIEDND